MHTHYVHGKMGAKLHGPAGEDGGQGYGRFTEPLTSCRRSCSQSYEKSAVVVLIGSRLRRAHEFQSEKTRIEGVFDLALPMSLDAREVLFVYWQRISKEQLGLRLEPGEERVEFFVIAHAERLSSGA